MSHSYLATAAADVKLWSVASSSASTAQPATETYQVKCSFSPHPTHNVSSLSWSHDNTLLAVSAKDSITIHDLNGYVVETVPTGPDFLGTDEVTACRFIQKSKCLVFAGSNKIVRIWNRQEHNFADAYTGHTTCITCLSINCEDALIASGSNSGDILIHNRLNGTLFILDSPTLKPIKCLEFSFFKRSVLAAASEDGSVHFWDTNRSNTPSQSFRNAHIDSATSLAFSPYNKYLLASSSLDRKIVLYDVERSGIVKTIGADAPLSKIGFKSDGVTLAVGTIQGKLHIYDLRQSAQPLYSVWAHEPNEIRSISFQLPESRKTMVKVTNKQTNKSISKAVSSLPTTQFSSVSTPVAVLPTHISSHAGGAFKIQSVNPATPKHTLLRAEKASYMDMFSPVHSSNKDPHSETPVLKSSVVSSNMKLSHNIEFVSNNNELQNIQLVSVKMPTDIFSPISKFSMNDQSNLYEKPSPLALQPASISEVNSYLNNPPSKLQSNNPSFTNSNANTNPSLCTSPPLTSSKTQHSPTPQTKESSPFSEKSEENEPPQFSLNRGKSSMKESANNKEQSECQPSNSITSQITPAPTGHDPSSIFQFQLLENVIEECLAGFKSSIRNDLQNMHLELLRQFQIQKTELEFLFQKYTDITSLVDEVERLREENKRLKLNY